jgi:hypothetical protein
MASAALELLDLAAPAPLFGGLRSGAAALLYHGLYVVLYAGIGFGLWSARPWGYAAVMAGTAATTLDKAQLLLARDTLYSYLMTQLTVTRDLVALVPRQQLLSAFSAAYILIVLCWWGFAGYVHLRRGYFGR